MWVPQPTRVSQKLGENIILPKTLLSILEHALRKSELKYTTKKANCQKKRQIVKRQLSQKNKRRGDDLWSVFFNKEVLVGVDILAGADGAAGPADLDRLNSGVPGYAEDGGEFAL